MALIDKMSILNAPDLKRETVDVPEWGEGAQVIVQEMTALDRDRLRLELQTEDSTQNIAAKILVRCLIDADGARLFVDEESEALGRKSVAVLNRLFAVAQRLNKTDITEDDVKN